MKLSELFLESDDDIMRKINRKTDIMPWKDKAAMLADLKKTVARLDPLVGPNKPTLNKMHHAYRIAIAELESSQHEPEVVWAHLVKNLE
jgi:hypothetical protein